MKTKNLVSAAVAAALIGVSAASPVVLAGDGHDKRTEQRAEYTEARIKDAWLDGKLETALLFNEHLNSFAIDTDVQGGVAYLSGSVESDIDRDLASEIAKSIDGVTEVKNELRIDKDEVAAARNEGAMNEEGFRDKVRDATLTAKVKTQLLVNGNTGGLSIDVDTENGIVTLSGSVDSSQESELAERIAANTDGTRSVVNTLTVEETEDAE